jgi:signal transduction histidine kinase
VKVIAKFAAAFFVVTALCFVGYSYLAARSEVHELEQIVATDLAGLADGLREGIVVVWAREGKAGAMQLIEAIQSRRTAERVRFVEARAAEDPEKAGDARPTEAGRVVSARVLVRVQGDVVGALEVERDLPSEASVLRGQLAEQLMFGAALATTAAVLAVALGGALIGRPLQSIVAQARRIGAGDLSQRLSERRTDEIGDLKRELNAMCDQLSAARERLEEEATARVETLEQLRHLDRLRTAGMLASSLAHELGTPLNVVLIRAQSLVGPDVSPDEVGDAGRTIATQVDKMSRIVRDLLDFSRRRGPAREPVALSAVASRAARLLQSLAKKHQVGIEVDVQEDSTIDADAAHLEQAVTNLMINGIHAMPRGGKLTLTVGAREAANRPGSARRTNAGFIEVRDEGVGIPADALERIFEPFYTTKPSGHGTGLGLTVARGIAEEHDGWIGAESAAGQGSAFTLYLPRPS